MPQRRMRLLHGGDFERHLVEGEVLALVVEVAGHEALQHDRQHLVEALGRGLGIDAEEGGLVGRGAAADAQLQPAAAHLVEHADLFGQAQRMIEAERIDQRTEAERGGALGDGGEEEAGRGRDAERRAVMFGHVIGVEARPFVELDQAQALFVLALGVRPRAIEVVEDAEFHCSLFRRGCRPILHTTTRQVACALTHS